MSNVRVGWIGRCLATASAVAVLVLAFPTSVEATDYYVSVSGADAQSGLSPFEAWRTIQRVNNQTFFPGDRIFFEGGQTFPGSLYFDSSDRGSAEQPIVVTSFGSGRATIYPGDGTGILGYNTAGFRIANLYIVGSGRDTNTASGIFFFTDLPGDVLLDFLEIDHVDAARFGDYGVEIGGNAGRSGFSNIRITYTIASENGRGGIFTYAQQRATHRHVYVGYSSAFLNIGFSGLSYNSGNGITLSGVDGATIERSISHDNGSRSDAGNGPIGIWTFSSNDVVIQFNESFNNNTGGTKDGGGFSLDNSTSNSVVQYNYSHDNAGAGYLLAHKWNDDVHSGNVIRYNVTQNDARKNNYAAIHLWGRIRHAEIYNNTVFIKSSATGSPRALHVRNNSIEAQDPQHVHFRNNIVQTTGSVRLIDVTAAALDGAIDLRFEGNVYWPTGSAFRIYWGGVTYSSLGTWRSASGQETLNGNEVGLSTDPQLTAPGAGPGYNNALLIGGLYEYRLQPTSPLIDAGLDLKSLFGIAPGARDYFGGAALRHFGYDIGAHEFHLSCNWTLSPASASLPAEGGVETVTVWAAADDCGWTALSTDAWLGTSPQTGSGAGSVAVWVSANTTASARSGAIKIAGQQFTVVQSALAGANRPPEVRISNPIDGATFAAGSSVMVNADATDSDGTIIQVDFYAGTTLVGTDASAPYTVVWTNPAIGTHTLTAIALDSAGAASTSAAIRVTIFANAGGTVPTPWKSEDVGNVGVAGSASYASDTFTVTGSGADIWGTADAFRFVYQPLNGDGTIVARVSSIENTNAWAKAGVMIRETLGAGSPHASMFVTPAKGLAFQRRASRDGTSASAAGPLAAAPKWVRVQRTGSTFTAAWSTDGTSWTKVGSATIAMSTSTLVGLAVTSHDNATTADALFDQVAVIGTAPPPPDAGAWTNQDIGSVSLAGSATQVGGQFTINGAGADIWGTADAFHFVYKRVSGDGQIVARVTSIGHTHDWAKAGVMIRETNTSGARHASMFVSAARGTAFQRRTTTAGTSVSTAGGLDSAPMWVKLVRAGSTFTAYRSGDGMTWAQVGSTTIAMGADVLWGLAVTSHNVSALCTATFENVSF